MSDLRYVVAVGIMLLSVATVQANPAAGLRECSRLDDGVKRLECFDRLASSHAPKITGALPQTGVGKWKVEQEVSKVDDSRNVFLNLESEQFVRGRFGGTKKADLVVRCFEKGTGLYFVFADHFMSDTGGHGQVTLRIDQQPAKTADMIASNNHKALGYFYPSQAIPLAKEFMKGRKLLVRATPFSESSITVEFDLTGLEAAIKPLRESCKW